MTIKYYDDDALDIYGRHGHITTVVDYDDVDMSLYLFSIGREPVYQSLSSMKDTAPKWIVFSIRPSDGVHNIIEAINEL